MWINTSFVLLSKIVVKIANVSLVREYPFEALSLKYATLVIDLSSTFSPLSNLVL